MLIIAIDPGISGSICFFKDGKIIDLLDMPNMAEGKKNKRQVNGAQIYNEILNRINRVQNFDYTFNVSRTSEGVLGKTMEVDRPIIEPPSIDITLSYFLDGGNNENRMESQHYLINI